MLVPLMRPHHGAALRCALPLTRVSCECACQVAWLCFNGKIGSLVPNVMPQFNPGNLRADMCLQTPNVPLHVRTAMQGSITRTGADCSRSFRFITTPVDDFACVRKRHRCICNESATSLAFYPPSDMGWHGI